MFRRSTNRKLNKNKSFEKKVNGKNGKILILAEKPSQARDYAQGLGNCKKREGYYDCGKFLITWAIGHLFEIDDSIAPKKWSLESLPIFPSIFKLRLRRGAAKQFRIIKKLLQEVNEVWIGTDPGREGELIAREILLMAGWKDWDKVKRIWTSEALTPEVVKKAIENVKPANLFDGLYYSALARQHSDWIVGINLTRLASLKANKQRNRKKFRNLSSLVWSVGRVQTPTLRFIIEREIEIKNFQPTPYWIIKALFEKGGEFNEKFWALLVPSSRNLSKNISLKEDELFFPEEENEENSNERNSLISLFAIKDKEQAQRIFQEIKEIPYGKVIDIVKKRKKINPPLLHSLTTLQREANKLYGFSAEKTLKIAQRLYETYKIISYPRTDSQYLSESNKSLVKEILRKLKKEELLPEVDKVGKRVFNDKKLTDHHAIIPLDLPSTPLNPDEEKIYHLIYRRFIGAFMSPYEYESITVFIKVGNYLFMSRGKRELSLGWKSLYKEFQPEENKIPPLKKGEKVKKLRTLLEERKTQPPPRYTENTLLKKMEKLGLGTPATRAQIIETLKKRGYIVVKKRKIYPTEKAFSLLELLKNSRVVSPHLTAEWEKKLEEIYTKKLNKKGYEKFLSAIKQFIKNEVERLKM